MFVLIGVDFGRGTPGHVKVTVVYLKVLIFKAIINTSTILLALTTGSNEPTDFSGFHNRVNITLFIST